MTRLTTDNPKGNIESLMNIAYVKDGRVYLSYADGENDIDLCEYVSRLANAKGYSFTSEDIMEDGLMEYEDEDFAVLYYLAVQAAELRARLKMYEDKAENGTLIDLPCKVGDTVYCIEAERITECEVIGIEIWMAFMPYRHLYLTVGYQPYQFSDIDKTIFLTKEEAEAKLKEMKENDN